MKAEKKANSDFVFAEKKKTKRVSDDAWLKQKKIILCAFAVDLKLDIVINTPTTVKQVRLSSVGSGGWSLTCEILLNY